MMSAKIILLLIYNNELHIQLNTFHANDIINNFFNDNISLYIVDSLHKRNEKINFIYFSSSNVN